MSTTPYAKVIVSINGVAQPTPYIDNVAGGSVIRLRGESTSGWTAQTWTLFAWPRGWAVPAGWAADGNGNVVSTDMNPTDITLPAVSVKWGKWLGNLTIQGGTKNGVPNHPECQDETWGWQTRSPGLGIGEVGFRENAQCDPQRRWAGTLQDAAHSLDAIVSPTSHTWVDTLLDGVASLILTDTTNSRVDCSGFTADRTMKLPAAPRINQCITFKFSDASLVSHNAIIDGNGNSVQGYQTAAAATYTMGNSPWGAYGSATFCFNGTIWETI